MTRLSTILSYNKILSSNHGTRQGKRFGVYMGVVTANTDQGSDSRYRVKVKLPELNSEQSTDETYWARIAIPMAGKQRGTYFLPEIDDQVLVVFERGDVGRPIIIGALWSDKQQPPEINADGKNNIKVIKSRSGHRLIFDDTQGAERVILTDNTSKNKIVLDSANKVVTIETADGDIELKASTGAVRISGTSVNMAAKQSFSGSSSVKVKVATDGGLSTKGSSTLTVKSNVMQQVASALRSGLIHPIHKLPKLPPTPEAPDQVKIDDDIG